MTSVARAPLGNRFAHAHRVAETAFRVFDASRKEPDAQRLLAACELLMAQEALHANRAIAAKARQYRALALIRLERTKEAIQDLWSAVFLTEDTTPTHAHLNALGNLAFILYQLDRSYGHAVLGLMAAKVSAAPSPGLVDLYNKHVDGIGQLYHPTTSQP